MSGKLTIDTKECERIQAKLGLNRAGILNRIAFEVEGLAKQLAPMDTRALRNSLHTEPATPDTPVATVADGVNYGIYQEYGTSRMRAQPFLQPAAESVGNKYNSGAVWEELVK